MKKILALLCALLLAGSVALAEGGTIVEFRERILLNGTLPAGCTFSIRDQTDMTLEGAVVSDDPAAPSIEIYIGFNDSYAQAENLKALDEDSLGRIKESFSVEYSVTFEQFDTAAGDALLMTRENGGQFLDFYTICLGYEIELSLVPAEGQTLTDAQVSQFLDFIRNLDIVPVYE